MRPPRRVGAVRVLGERLTCRLFVHDLGARLEKGPQSKRNKHGRHFSRGLGAVSL